MSFGMFGAAAALGISAFGSALGLAIAGQGTIGAWKRCYLNNKPAPFILLAFAGAPLTQTIYGFLLMNKMLTSQADPWFLLGVGVACGLGIAASAIAQGKAAAAGSDALHLRKPVRASVSTLPLLVFAKPSRCSLWFSD